MAVVAEGDRGRIYLTPTPEMEAIAQSAQPVDLPETELPKRALGFRVQEYGMTKWRDLFTPRQLVALTTISDLVLEVWERVKRDALAMGISDAGGYACAVSTYLGLAVGRVSDYCSTICTWANNPQMEIVRGTFARQALPMTWDFAEANLFGPSTGSIGILIGWVVKAIERLPTSSIGEAQQRDAAKYCESPTSYIVSTDPPYYDNIGYADLSDFFYVWLRRCLKPIYPDLFATVAVPKIEELIASPYRQGSKERAGAFFIEGMTRAMHQLAKEAFPGFPVTIYYAFKQSETDGEEGTSSTGWETFLDAVIKAGFALTGTWPIRTERSGRTIGIGTNALASSIVLVCRPRQANEPTATRREFVSELKAELPLALAHLQRGNIAPVDLAQAAIGPGMAVYTRYARVVDAGGKSLSVREALALINETLDEAFAEQEGDFDADSRFAIAWFEQSGFSEGEFGVADVLARAKVTSVPGLAQDGILVSKGGRVRLLKPDELALDWDPTTDPRLTIWEIVHHLIRVLEAGGEGAAAQLAATLGAKAEVARELAYRLYTIAERKKRAVEALSYNGLVQSWPEIMRLARENAASAGSAQADIFA